MPYPSRAQVGWSQTQPNLQRALIWLDACQVLRRVDLEAVAWPDGAPASTISTALSRWIQAGLIVPLDTCMQQYDVPLQKNTIFMLGPTGVQRLRERRIFTEAPRKAPQIRVLPGMLLASHIAVSLARDLRCEPRLTAFTWRCRPFTGDGVRSDGEGVLEYRRMPGPADAILSVDLLTLPAPRDLVPPHGAAQAHLFLEVDMGSEERGQLAERARRWGVRYRELAVPDAPYLSYQVLWVVHSDRRRVNTIRNVWRQHAACPLLIATVKDLTIDGVMHPWHAQWSDVEGRPCTLRLCPGANDSRHQADRMLPLSGNTPTSPASADTDGPPELSTVKPPWDW
jgi:hypothetical protein